MPHVEPPPPVPWTLIKKGVSLIFTFGYLALNLLLLAAGHTEDASEWRFLFGMFALALGVTFFLSYSLGAMLVSTYRLYRLYREVIRRG